MSRALDLCLDDIIQSSKISSSSSFRGRGRGTRPGPARRFPNRLSNRAAPYSTAKAPETTRQHGMFSGQATGGCPASDRTKLYISNFDYGVSNEDIKELFSDVGEVLRYAVHYDRSGRSKGTAEVVFARQSEAVAAVKRYNNVQLDGKPMKIEIVGAKITAPAPPPLPHPRPAVSSSNFGRFNGYPRGRRGRGVGMGRPRGGSGGCGLERGGGRGRGHGEKVSAEDLDADLEKYHSEAMEIN